MNNHIACASLANVDVTPTLFIRQRVGIKFEIINMEFIADLNLTATCLHCNVAAFVCGKGIACNVQLAELHFGVDCWIGLAQMNGTSSCRLQSHITVFTGGQNVIIA